MPILALADTPVGKPSVPKRWNKKYQQEELNPFDAFVWDRLHTKEAEQLGLQLISRNFSPVDACHDNYMAYLEKCWADHLGAVVTPDILWYTILCELVSIVKETPETYRHLFSVSDEKQTIAIQSDSLTIMPLDVLVLALVQHVPTSDSLFIPMFSTTDEFSRHANYAAFCDMCSPFYKYEMYLCGIPWIDVRGEAADYILIGSMVKRLKPLFPGFLAYLDRVQQTIENCVTHLDDPAWWQGIFKLERCGSGSQQEVSGWLTDLFVKKPVVKFTSNYTSGIAVVDYEQTNTHKHYRMLDGLFGSQMRGDFLVPMFGSCVFEKTKGVEQA